MAVEIVTTQYGGRPLYAVTVNGRTVTDWTRDRAKAERIASDLETGRARVEWRRWPQRPAVVKAH